MSKNRECILELIEENFVCAEVGVWKGEFSRQIISKNPSKLYLIDPWITQDYANRWYSIEQQKMDKIYEDVCDQFKDNQSVKIIRSMSTDVEIQQKLDLVYIDANHSYEFVLADLQFYYNLMKPNSYITGDDFRWTDPSGISRGPGAAVKEFCLSKNLNFNVINNQFIIKLGGSK